MIKTYSISSDFPNKEINSSKLSEEIENNETITTSLDYINTENDDCNLYFDGDLIQN